MRFLTVGKGLTSLPARSGGLVRLPREAFRTELSNPVIDKPQSGFLDSWGFGVRNPKSRVFLPLLAVAAGLGGCSPQSKPAPVEDSVTSGRISVVCASEAFDLIARERSTFQNLYPQASLELRNGTSREAIAALFANQADVAVITRELIPEERRAAQQGGLELEGYRFARDAVVMIVHPSNPIENVSLDQVRRIYRGEATAWSEIGGAGGRIEPVYQAGGSDVTAFFTEEALKGDPFTGRAIHVPSDSATTREVSRNPLAIGYVTLAGVRPGTKVLRLASLTGLPYWKPDLEAVYQGQYPLTRFHSLYVRTQGPRVASGFVTFVTSREGQRLVHEAGLVPAAVPVRFVRRSPMLGTHSTGEPIRTP